MTCEVAVTGANGYVGSRIAAAMERRGHRVRRLQRSGSGADIRRFTLGEPLAPDALTNVDALVHCAYDFSATSWPAIRASNVDATTQLFDAARVAGVRTLVFISSMSAFPGCRSMYGRAKLEAEGQLRPMGAVIVRPGLVYGPDAAGMVGALSRLLRIPAFVPLVGRGDQILFLVHEDDLGAMLADVCERGTSSTTPLIAASARPFALREILELLAKRQGLRRHFVPVPWRLEWGMLRAAELAGARMRLRSDSLVSLLNQDPAPDFTASAPFVFRDFETFATAPARSARAAS